MTEPVRHDVCEGVTLYQGDTLAVLPLLPAGSVDCVLADPPYGIGYGKSPFGSRPSQRNKSAVVVKRAPIAGDDAVDARWLGEAFRVLVPGGALYLCCRWDVEPEWREAIRGAGFRLKQRLTWHKRDHGMGDVYGTFGPTCEDVLFATKGRHTLRSRPSMLLDAGCVPTWEWRHHPHQKPTALFRPLIEASTGAGGLVLDPFMGSGSAGVACLETGRRFVGIELDPEYFAAARHRLSGTRPALGISGPLFDRATEEP